MAIGSVTIGQVNNYQGTFKQPERTFLYVGTAGENAAAGVVPVNAVSDLDTLFGTETSNLKTQLTAAILNAADDNFFAYAVSVADGTGWAAKVLPLLDKPNDLNVEAVVVCDPVSSNTDVVAAQTFAENVRTMYAKFVTVHLCVAGIGASETWAAYATKVKAIITGAACDRVSITPLLHGNNLGCVCGRLCSPAADIADTPMRVKTGAVLGLGDAPADSASAPLTLAIIKDLADARFSVPQWYAGYDGMYWGDMPLLDVEGGDYQVYEYRRIIDYLARQVRILAIQRVADRALNSTAASVAQNQTYFASPLRAAAKERLVGGKTFPGMILPPDSGDVSISWSGKTVVDVDIMAQPYNCPKKIRVTLGLNLANE